MKIKKAPLIVLVVTLIILIVFMFLEMNGKKNSNITKNQTELSMKEFKKNYNTQYLNVVLDNGGKRTVIEDIAKELNAEIIESNEDINNYRLDLKKTLSAKKALNLIEELESYSDVAYVEFDFKNKEEEKYFNSDNPENDKMFERALAEYNGGTSVFYAEDGEFTFLYPSEYALKYKKGKIKIGDDKIIVEPFVKSPLGVLEDVAMKMIAESGETSETQESYTMYSLPEKNVVKWFNGEVFTSLIQTETGYYKVTSTDEKYNNLVTDSFYINESTQHK